MAVVEISGGGGSDQVTKIVLDARTWRSEADFIEAVIAGLGGPAWHGRNYNALHDSMVTGSINRIEQPIEFVMVGTGSVGPKVQEAIDYFDGRVREWRETEGAQITVAVMR
jgi:hypothetical protein